jgi:polyhydroxyalkanoate synthesis regulator phasin
MAESTTHKHPESDQRIRALEEQVKKLEQQLRDLEHKMKTHDHPHSH